MGETCVEKKGAFISIDEIDSCVDVFVMETTTNFMAMQSKKHW